MTVDIINWDCFCKALILQHFLIGLSMFLPTVIRKQCLSLGILAVL